MRKDGSPPPTSRPIRWLGLGADALGQPLAEVAPELQAIAETPGRTGGEAEMDLDLVRSGDTRRACVPLRGPRRAGWC